MNAQTDAVGSDIKGYMRGLGEQARQAGRDVARAETGVRNRALEATADAIYARRQQIKDANDKDMEAGRSNGLDSALLDRLQLTDARMGAMAEGLRQIAALPDPVGAIRDMSSRPSGIQVGRMRVPLGVVGIVYESRPNVTADAAALCLKSGNAAILRGGSEAIHSNQAIAACIGEGLLVAGLPETAVQVVATTDREAVGELITMDDYVDVLVPRGGKGLITRIMEGATVPMIKHLEGVCHVYLDSDANPDKAQRVAINAKTQRYGTCNTMETLLIHETVAPELLPAVADALAEHGVSLRGCPVSRDLCARVGEASDADWDSEYLAPELAVRVVADLDQAIEHIEAHSSRHTDAIVTENWSKAQRFLREVDSSSVMVNASTRFADGFEYGLGAEIGVSTDKLHARGPVGLEGLTSEKFVVLGNGHIRE